MEVPIFLLPHYSADLYTAHAITILLVFQMNIGEAPPLVATDMMLLTFVDTLLCLLCGHIIALYQHRCDVRDISTE